MRSIILTQGIPGGVRIACLIIGPEIGTAQTDIKAPGFAVPGALAVEVLLKAQFAFESWGLRWFHLPAGRRS